MTLLYPNVARDSCLVPIQSDPEWCFTDRVLSDLPPGAAGVGAVQTAVQALNLSVDNASKLVASGGNSNVPAATLAKAANATFFSGAAGFAAAASKMSGAFAGRIPIPSTVATAVAILAGDDTRVSLLIQNNNASGNANLLVSVDGAIDTGSPWAYVNLVPGQGIFMDQNAWTNAIYVAWGSGTVVGGVLMYGSKPAVSNPTAGGAAPAGAFVTLGGPNTTGSF